LSNLSIIHTVRENEQITAKVAKHSLEMVVAGLQSFEHEITSGRNHTQISFLKTVVLRKAKSETF
jgi:hypothetical protein